MASLPNGYTNGSRVLFLSGETTATFVLFISAATTAINNVFVRAREAARDLARSLRDFVDELPRIVRAKLPPPPAVITRIVLQPVAPVLSMEPEFVGAGLAFRRWR